MRTRTLGTYSSHMPVKTLTLERQERDETRNMAKQTGVHDVIDVIVPALMLPRLCQAASKCCTRMPSTRAARRLGRSWPCAGCAGVTRGAGISDVPLSSGFPYSLRLRAVIALEISREF